MKYIKCEVLIIGSGGAGIRAAIELKDRKKDVLVVGKCKIRDAHTIMAKGGINAALSNEDSWKIHAADTIKDGGMINNPEAVEILCKNAPNAVKELDKWGANFHKENGKITQRLFGAATFKRACFVGDQTGKAILNTLIDQAMKRNVKTMSEVYIFKLTPEGAIGIDTRKGNIVVIQSKITILATGGHSRVFSRSSSWFWENSGDGIKLAYDMGASFMDMEMFQFHPTGMVYPKEMEGQLVTEAIRGEGGILTNSKGERFMKRYDKRMELSSRDVVARANYNEIESGRGTRHNGVFLDITSKSLSYIKNRLPSMYRQFKKYNKINISKQKMEVAPTAHYSMGGIKVDHKTGATGVKNLFAVGEVTSGLHGGNRLGGNSLAEIVVFGRLVGRFVSKQCNKVKEKEMKDFEDSIEWLKLFMSSKGQDSINKKKEFQLNMWKHVGVVRDKKSMENGLKYIEKFKKMRFKTGSSFKKNEKLMNALDLQNMIPTSEMIIKSALKRKESRAAHYRKDYPQINPKWRKNIVCTPTKNSIKISYSNVKPVRKDVKKYMGLKSKYHMLE